MTTAFQHDAALRSRIATHLATPRRPAQTEGRRPAAVAITLAALEDGRSALYLTLRAPRLAAHSGQYALPGGKVDPGETAEQAALRELQEELGLTGGAVLGQLDLLPTRSGYAVSPYVIWFDGVPVPRPDPAEVARLHRIPLADLFAEDPGGPDPRGDDPAGDYPAPGVFWLYIPTLGHRVYAPTAAMLFQFRELALMGRDTPAPQFAEPDFARR